MAEEESELELDTFKKGLDSLLKSSATDERGLQSKTYCERFCELVVEQTGRWQVPLPQLQVLRSALCSFVQGVESFPPECEHVQYTLSSLALSVFELLLFFGKEEFVEHPLKDILDSFQDCYACLVRHHNVYLLQVRHIIKDGGPWANPVLQAILKNSELPQKDADRYLSSEVSIFFELRVRYLVACERLPEAIALAKRCSHHSVVGRHLYFMQAYLTCLWRASFHECFYKEMANIDGKDAVEMLCMMENEEKDDMVLTLSKGFLSQQLQNGDMYYLWDLVFIWSKLYLRVNRFKQGFLEECKQMILSVTNIKAVFPFMKVILEELGKDGLGFCVELCARALQSDLKNDPVTKSILYKTIAHLLPNDLEFCRACALLVFFLERTVESYRTVFLLYAHPDQEYHADTSPLVNNVRYEVLQILKKGLLFDPEFWSLLNIETHCLRLMSDKVAKAALCDIMQKDKWAQSFCMKGFCHCHTDDTARTVAHVDKPTNRNDQEVELVETLVTPASGETSSKPPGKKRGRKPGSKLVKYPDPCPVRQSLRQIDVAKNHARQLNSRFQRFLARQAEGTTRRGRKPQWLLEELAAQAENSVPQQGKKRGRKPKQSDVLKEILVDAPVNEIPLKFSYPDNEVELSSETEASLFSTETPQVTESSTVKTKTAHQEVSKWPPNSSSSLLKLLSVETSACKKKDYRVGEEVVFTEQGLSIIQKFHTYSRVTDLEEITIGILSRNQEVKPDANEFKKERLVQSTEGTTQTDATQIPAINLETSTPVEAASGPTEELIVEPKANLAVLCPQTVNTKCPENTVSPPENVNVDLPPEATSFTAADIIPVPGCMPANTTTENMRTEDAPAVLTEVTSVPDDAVAVLSKSEVPVSSEIVHKDTTMSELPAGPQSPAEVLQDTHTDVNNCLPDLISTSVGSERLSTKCSLCNKETKYQYILRHAMWHYRTDRKCMFCHKRYTHGRSPSVHFKLHIQELKKSNGRFKENICKSVTELPETAKQKLLKRMNRSVQNKFRNIKMRLNSSLNVADLHKEKHGSESQVRLRTRLAKNSEPTNTLEEEEEEKVCRKKRRLRRVLARKSQSTDENKKFRMRLARKRAKTMQVPEEEDSNTTGNSANRLNGMIRKRKVRKVKKEEDASDEKTLLTEDSSQQKIEFIEHADKNAPADVVKTESENVELTNLDGKDIIESEMRGNDSTMLNSAKRLPQGDHKKDVVAVKKRKIIPKVVSEKQEHKENASAAKEINTIGQKKGTPTKPKQRSTLFQGKRTGASTEVRCPVEICTFSAKSILVLSHVLSHHHGDKKALVFFFNFGKEKCLFCSRKVCNAQHFFDHVMCHRGELKHPCYHHGCKERFQTRVELSDHMLGHHPLRAICCFPGCPMQVDSILHLYKHERTHYRLDANLEQNLLPIKVELTQDGTERNMEPATDSLKSQLVHDTVKHKGPANQDDEVKHLVLNKGAVNYSSKNSSLINGHSESDKEVPDKPSNTATKKQEPPVSGKPATKQFIRPPPSAYLDESYLSMPKRWKEHQVGSKLLGTVSSGVTNTNRQRCSRCFESFSSEEELQTHKDKCTSLFGFDSDDESK
ncbi:putative zinc finger protein 654 [Triplophysa rosa]|uniref:Zinc finger protein 654 n=1 Tax=Triplophysa rosa TaxID=992332 RepID=A0A9W7WZC6_TRIRA|nr:putative zinc finger protein 654 [Triplophysa rosa]